jgi:O-antigen ligase
MTDPQSGQHGRPLSPDATVRGRGEDGAAALAATDAADHHSAMSSGPARKWVRGLTWARSPNALVVAGLLLSVLLLAVIAFVQFVLAPATAVTIGIVLVVTLGAGGLAARGVGELRDSRPWKSSGCFMCAGAYLGTATVALVNGVPLVFGQ